MMAKNGMVAAADRNPIPLGPVLVDRLALPLINRRQLRRDFEWQEGGALLVSDEARKRVLTAWQERERAAKALPFAPAPVL